MNRKYQKPQITYKKMGLVYLFQGLGEGMDALLAGNGAFCPNPYNANYCPAPFSSCSITLPSTVNCH